MDSMISAARSMAAALESVDQVIEALVADPMGASQPQDTTTPLDDRSEVLNEPSVSCFKIKTVILVDRLLKDL